MKFKSGYSVRIDPNGYWPKRAIQEFLPKATAEESRQVRESMARAHETVLKSVTANRANKWYADRALPPGKPQIAPEPILKQMNIIKDPVGYYTYIFFSPSPQPNLAALGLYGELLTALSEAIVENACAKGTLAHLSIALGQCRSILQGAESDVDLMAAVTSFGTFFTVQTDVLDWDRMSMLCAALYLCASEGYSRRVIGYCDLLCRLSHSTSSITESARLAYDVSPSVRDALRETLKPFLRPDWGEQAAATAIQRMAYTLEVLIQRAHDTEITKSTRSMQSQYDLMATQPYAMLNEATRAFASEDLAKIKLYFSDAIGNNTACLFGLYRLACKDTIWLDCWIGAFNLSATLYQTPQRLAVKMLYGARSPEGSEAAWDQVRPVFDVFTPAQAKGKASPDTAGQPAMQQILHFLGLRLFAPDWIAQKRALAEGTYRNLLKVCAPPSGTMAGAFAAASFLLQLNTSDGAYRVQTAAELSASENARAALQRQHNSLQKKSRHQESYADAVTRANAVFEGKLAKLQQQNEDLQTENEDLKQQINQLLDLLDKRDEEETPAEAEIAFPADLSPCTAYLFGGHPDFQTKLRQLIPDLRMAEADQRVDKQAVSNADVVFLQAAHISHSTFYTVMGICKASNIPVVYLTSTSAKQAAVQIVGEIERRRGL